MAVRPWHRNCYIEWAKSRQEATDYDERILWAKIQFAWELILAQEEELARDAINRRNRDRLVQRLAELKAENQALKAKMQKAYSDINNWIAENG